MVIIMLTHHKIIIFVFKYKYYRGLKPYLIFFSLLCYSHTCINKISNRNYIQAQIQKGTI